MSTDCDCRTVKRYDDEWRCMQCYAQFVPFTSSLEQALRADYPTIEGVNAAIVETSPTDTPSKPRTD